MADNMQSQAMERLKQMYSKAQTTQGSGVGTVNTAPASQKQKSEEKSENTEQVDVPKKEDAKSKKRDSLAELFLKDKEKSLILLLIVLLISEKAESSVVLALLYLIL